MTDLFEKPSPEDNQPPEDNSQTQTSNYTDLLAGIKNENGEQKFKTIEDLANGYSASQSFISTLKTEKSSVETLNAELSGKVKSQDELTELLNTAKPKEDIAEVPQIPASITLDDVAGYLEQRDAQSVVDDNVRSVKAAMQEAYGADASSKLLELSEAAGLDKGSAQSLAQSSPQALLKLLGVKGEKEVQSVNASVNTHSFESPAQHSAKSIMNTRSTQDFMNEWKNSNKRVLDRLES